MKKDNIVNIILYIKIFFKKFLNFFISNIKTIYINNRKRARACEKYLLFFILKGV